MPLLTLSEWDEFLGSHASAHLLQSGAWGELKSAFGWDVHRLRVGETGAQVLFKRLPLGLSIAYIPKGPLGVDWTLLWPVLDTLCHQKRVIFLKIEPDAWGTLLPRHLNSLADFLPAPPIQPRQTVVVSLAGSEEDWLAHMKPKTRYNIRLAARKGVLVTESSDLAAFHRLMTATGNRDGFGVHSLTYYQKAHELFASSGDCVLLVAKFEDKPLAGLMVFRMHGRAWYFYGASSDEERSRMPAYLLQWEAMRWADCRDCREYDLWGIPDFPEEKLESEFETQSGGLWGVYRFKRGFGGSVQRSVGAWDRIYQPVFYRFYRWYMKRRLGDG